MAFALVRSLCEGGPHEERHCSEAPVRRCQPVHDHVLVRGGWARVGCRNVPLPVGGREEGDSATRALAGGVGQPQAAHAARDVRSARRLGRRTVVSGRCGRQPRRRRQATQPEHSLTTARRIICKCMVTPATRRPPRPTPRSCPPTFGRPFGALRAVTWNIASLFGGMALNAQGGAPSGGWSRRGANSQTRGHADVTGEVRLSRLFFRASALDASLQAGGVVIGVRRGVAGAADAIVTVLSRGRCMAWWLRHEAAEVERVITHLDPAM